MIRKASDFAYNFSSTIKGIIKIALQSRKCDFEPQKDVRDKSLIILANGPSLRKTLEEYRTNLIESDTLAVNFAANTAEFIDLKPKYYVLADPHFFTASEDKNVSLLIDNLKKVDWRMTLFIDRRFARKFKSEIKLPANVSIKTFNAVGVEGFAWFEKLAYGLGWAMPRPRNVLIPALMTAIRLGYSKIYLCGADHSWMRELHVDENNHVVSGMTHFYKESEKETTRVKNEYQSYKLHEIIFSLFVAFRSYHAIARFADHKGVNIYNSTENSYIDAFPRTKLPF